MAPKPEHQLILKEWGNLGDETRFRLSIKQRPAMGSTLRKYDTYLFLEDLVDGACDHPIVYDSHRVAYDHPEIFPSSIKGWVRRHVAEIDEKIRWATMNPIGDCGCQITTRYPGKAPTFIAASTCPHASSEAFQLIREIWAATPVTTRELLNSMDEFTRSYIEAALWSSPDTTCEEGSDANLDVNFGPEDIAEEELKVMIADCKKFQEDNRGDIHHGDGAGPARISQAGHDFWLTRNGHGAGFWDGPPRWPEEIGQRLTAACKKYKEVDLYVGDDGRVHA